MDGQLFYLPALAALAFLIVVHESGHYVVARWCRMRIERFSIGFGPGILKHRSKKTGTTFQLAPIPFGGFVEIRGMNIAEEVDPDDAFAYPNRPAWQRFVTIFAGPATNYLSAVVLAFALYTCHGVNSTERWYAVDEVLAGYDAMGKLQRGDRILEVDHAPLLFKVGDTLTDRVNAKRGGALVITVRRGEQTLDVSITPRPDTDSDGRQRYLLGIAPTLQSDIVDIGVLDAAGRAVVYPVTQSKAILGGLYDIITGKQKPEATGAIGMTGELKKAFQRGFPSGVELVMLLSVYLGLFNLLPLPALDGGRLVFLAYELVTRRRANPKIETMVHMGGIMILMVVLILVTFKDCRNLFGG